MKKIILSICLIAVTAASFAQTTSTAPTNTIGYAVWRLTQNVQPSMFGPDWTPAVAEQFKASCKVAVTPQEGAKLMIRLSQNLVPMAYNDSWNLKSADWINATSKASTMTEATNAIKAYIPLLNKSTLTASMMNNLSSYYTFLDGLK